MILDTGNAVINPNADGLEDTWVNSTEPPFLAIETREGQN
jgi:hypothetical protein